MVYTRNWNNSFIENTKGLINLNLCLEIGCFEGLTSNYIIENILSPEGKLICIDPLLDTYIVTDLTEEDIVNNKTIYSWFNKQYDRFIENTKHQTQLELYRNTSEQAFPELISKYKNQIDLVYIDGDHRASVVYIDAINSFKLCKPNGLIIFDDYKWNAAKSNAPGIGIDKFLYEYKGQYKIVAQNYQILIRKNDIK